MNKGTFSLNGILTAKLQNVDETFEMIFIDARRKNGILEVYGHAPHEQIEDGGWYDIRDTDISVTEITKVAKDLHF